MGNIVEDVRTYLKTKSAITSIVGSGNDAKIFLYRAKQSEPDRPIAEPYIVMEGFGGGSDEHLGGIGGIATNRIQIDCYSTTAALAYTLAEAVRLAPLQMYRGTAGSSTIVTCSSNGGYRQGEDPSPFGSSQRRFWVSRDYIIQHREATS